MSGTLTFTFLEWGLCLLGGAFSHILYFVSKQTPEQINLTVV